MQTLTPFSDKTLLTLECSMKWNGGTPTTFLDTFEGVMRRRDWERRGVTLRDFIESRPPRGMGTTVDHVRLVIQLQHGDEDDPHVHDRMEWLRRAFRREFPSADDVLTLADDVTTAAQQVREWYTRDELTELIRLLTT